MARNTDTKQNTTTIKKNSNKKSNKKCNELLEKIQNDLNIDLSNTKVTCQVKNDNKKNNKKNIINKEFEVSTKKSNSRKIDELIKAIETETKSKSNSNSNSKIERKPLSVDDEDWVVETRYGQLPIPKTRYLSLRGYVVLKKEFTDKQIDILKDITTAKIHDQYTERVNTFPVYLENDNKMYLPRFLGYQLFGEPNNPSKITDGKSHSLEFKGKLQNVQIPIVEAMNNAFKEKGGGFLNLRCGSGKTVLALYAVTVLKKKTLVVVHKGFLIDQWIERAQQFLPDAKIGLIKGSKLEVEGTDIVLATIQSLSMKKYSNEIFEEFGLMILDECHRMPSEVFSRALQRISTKYILGLSATTNRKDGLMKQLKWFIGPIFYSNVKNDDSMSISHKNQEENPNTKINEYKILVDTYKIYSDNEKYIETPISYNGRPNSAKMINNVTSHSQKNALIIQLIKKLVKEKPNKKHDPSFQLNELNKRRQIIVLSDRRDQLNHLQSEIEKDNIGTVGQYVGGMKQVALKESESKRIILATYSMAREGLDIKTLNTLILASPVSDVEQSVGRILRNRQKCVEENKIPLFYPKVLDIVDNFSIFIAQARKREKYYVHEKVYMTRYRVNDYDKKLEIIKTEDETKLGNTTSSRGNNKNTKSHINSEVKTETKSSSKKSNYTKRDPGHFFESVFSQ